MSGVAAPLYPVVEPFAADAVIVTDVTLPIPVPDQTGVLVGAASFSTGFPPATRTDPEAGGIAPYGQDMNGILYMLSVYCALMQAGQIVPYNAAAAAAFGGYVVGAKIASAAVLGRVWTNYLDANTGDPDIDVTGWAASDPLASGSAPAAGTINNFVLPGFSDYALDIDTTAGNVDITGFVARRNGQRIYISNVGANLLQSLANNAGSLAANRVRAPTDLALVQNQTLTLEYFSALTRWLLV